MMNEINYSITGEDIREYLKKHKEDENIRYQEAMFVKYMRETESFSKEAIEILLAKYNTGDNRYQDIGFNKMMDAFLPTFNSYLSSIKNLDVSGVCHMIIPAIRFYGNRTSLKAIHIKPVLEALKVESMGDEDDILLDTMENYKICNQLRTIDNHYEITMNEPRANRELEKYKDIYGSMPILRMEKVIKMGRY